MDISDRKQRPAQVELVLDVDSHVGVVLEYGVGHQQQKCIGQRRLLGDLPIYPAPANNQPQQQYRPQRPRTPLQEQQLHFETRHLTYEHLAVKLLEYEH